MREFIESGAIAIVLEDGKPLGPTNTQHELIRNYGKGLCSIWHDTVYLSASDNSDCNANGRSYTLVAVDFARSSATYRQVIEQVAGSDADSLGVINKNSGRNNSFFLNFFGYFNTVTAVLSRNGIAFPQSAFEIGSGASPYAAVRFLLEGTRRFVANDISPVGAAFDAALIQEMRPFLSTVAPPLARELDRLKRPNPDGTVSIEGLEICAGVPFEEAPVDGQFDLIFSTSVLEHVKRPREVVQRMWQLLKPGAYAWHSIDLRDHRDFSRPLGFLELSEHDYAAIDTENRLRASDWLDLFGRSDFELVECEFGAFKSASDHSYVYSLTRPEQSWLDEGARANFKPPFDAKDAIDLSILAVRILARKPV
jgi:SAM-dependent methyltransferase